MSHKSLYQIKKALEAKRAALPSQIRAKADHAKYTATSLEVNLLKDGDLLRWYASSNGFYLGTQTYYSVKARYIKNRETQKQCNQQYKDLMDELRKYC